MDSIVVTEVLAEIQRKLSEAGRVCEVQDDRRIKVVCDDGHQYPHMWVEIRDDSAFVHDGSASYGRSIQLADPGFYYKIVKLAKNTTSRQG